MISVDTRKRNWSSSIVYRPVRANGRGSSIACSRFISMNRKAELLISYRVIVGLIGAAATTGMTVCRKLDCGV